MPSSLSNQTPHGRRIKVLFVTDEMEVGGTQRQIVLLAKSLDPEQFDVTVVYFCNRSFLVDELEASGIRTVEIEKRGRFSPTFVVNFVRFLKRERFDVMHCYAFTGELWGTIARLFVSRHERPALITSVRNKYDWYTPLQWRLKRWGALQSAHVIANSRAGGEHARECMQLPLGAIDVVYNGVADFSNANATPPHSHSTGVVTALFVGRLVDQKNVPLLVRAMHRLGEKHVSLRLKVAGDGPLRAQIEQLISELKLGHTVELLGERSDARELMAACDFVVSPSLREGLSNVILEAMMVGRPVIASAVGGSVELVEQNETGMLFPSEDVEALANAMLTMTADAPLRARLGESSRKRAIERYSVDAMVTSMSRTYRECATNPAAIPLAQRVFQ
jgi:glycosyltransferase involved in cell wall biosynthesis